MILINRVKVIDARSFHSEHDAPQVGSSTTLDLLRSSVSLRSTRRHNARPKCAELAELMCGATHGMCRVVMMGV